ncbi:DNA internalization-related competence protein ComEC/Rec2 [Fictibacillus sp. Mic-4]|uniref:DNA internalization-related competence protein ComEC/Rec2 n=1 Tax=Fictibacillus TaxID=1329200 RepID=UPI000408988D|nr:DNA internalization-related competence protein ComEC/Rec2 [Fictibacillus gelatini]
MFPYLYVYALCAIFGIVSARFEWFWAIFIIAPFYFLKKYSPQQTTICICFFLLFYAYFQFIDTHNHTGLSPSTTSFKGTIASIPEINGNFLTFRFQVQSETLQVNHSIHSESEQRLLKKRLKMGMICSFTGRLKEPRAKENFAGMDYRLYLKQEHIHWLVQTTNVRLSNCTLSNPDRFDEIWKIRESGIRYIETNFPEEMSGLMNALIFGYRNGISREVINAYQQMGLTHILAVSGSNVAILAAAFFFVCIRSGLTREAAIHLIVAIIPVYMLLTGGEASIIRAGSMSIFVLLFVRLRWKMHPLEAISFVCLLMLLYNPYFVFNLGFQLSFLISMGLLLSANSIMKHCRYFLSKLIATTFLCQLISFPLLIYSFYEFSIWSIPLNVLYIPLISIVILPFSIVTFIIHLIIPQVSYLLVILLKYLIRLSSEFLLYMTEHTGTFIFGKPPIFFLLLYYVAILYYLIQWEANGVSKKLVRPVSAISLVLLLHWFYPFLLPFANVTFLNVGQGDSILIELPFRKGVYLIDTGGTVSFQEEKWEEKKSEYNVTEQVVLPALKSRGIRAVDKLILTHGDLDHIGGANIILSELNVKEVLYPTGKLKEKVEKKVLQYAVNQHIPIQVARKGLSWKEGNDQFFILSPYGNEEKSNDRSIVIYARIENVYFLFTGDLEKSGEKRIVQDTKPFKVNVLKAGHHGSKTSSSFELIKHIGPDYVIISAGKNNRYGHPHEEVLKRLKEQGTTIIRTDESGDISFKLEGKRMKIITTKK